MCKAFVKSLANFINGFLVKSGFEIRQWVHG